MAKTTGGGGRFSPGREVGLGGDLTVRAYAGRQSRETLQALANETLAFPVSRGARKVALQAVNKLFQEGRILLVLREGGKLVGLAALDQEAKSWEANRHVLFQVPRGDYLYLHALATTTKGGGHGRRLLDQVVSYANSRRAGVWLTAKLGAHGFYRKMGLKSEDEFVGRGNKPRSSDVFFRPYGGWAGKRPQTFEEMMRDEPEIRFQRA